MEDKSPSGVTKRNDGGKKQTEKKTQKGISYDSDQEKAGSSACLLNGLINLSVRKRRRATDRNELQCIDKSISKKN